MELECNDAARIDHTSRGLMNWDSFTRDDYESETFQADQLAQVDFRRLCLLR